MSADRQAASFGGKLRDARERRGVSLRQIANATKISVAALEALERNDLSRLPGGIFSRAFVRSYAVEVGLDPETTIKEFIAQFPNDAAVTAGHPTSDRVEDREAIASERMTAGTFLWLAMISIPLVAGLLYLTSAGRAAAPKSIEPVAAAADPGVKSPEPDAADPSPPAAPAASAPVLQPASATAPAAASTLPPTQAPAAALTPAAPDASADELAVGLSVRRPCWVTATVDGQKKLERLLRPGEQQTFAVRREMVLTAGDASALALTFNGAAARPLGKTDEVVTLRFNPTNFKNYLQER
jgi:cytoskeleton protein RodZ